ncbi:hypothetical protein K2173_010410 [Erythroxylum novogranatense]|uniref:RRM domain-containing protein n=1 Tax=Erythroxylum novogranatense TaxID=1862640 RepID=A0AAV8TFC3_9ROSI|nr:hypothetical protein K2173_010410 [Erythroxylum novogranatense]
MGVVGNAVDGDSGMSSGVGSSSSSSQNSSVSSVSSSYQDHHLSSHNHHIRPRINNCVQIQPLYMKAQVQSPTNGDVQNLPVIHHHQRRSICGDGDFQSGEDVGDSYKRDMRELQEFFSKLNPMAEEFVPHSFPSNHNTNGLIGLNGLHGLNASFYTNNIKDLNNLGLVGFHSNGTGDGQINGSAVRRKKSFGQEKRRLNTRTSMAQREEIIRRTVYVSDIDQQVTEEQLAALFVGCGQVVDCRICGDPNSVLRFAFIEFTDEEGVRAALNLSGTMLGFYPVKVLPSKTAIAPVNPTFLPRNDDEREMCSRTIYCTNIDKKVTQAEIRIFFESFCGEVYRLRLLGDYHHPTRIAFVEFVMAESAIAALNCSGVVLGTLPIRVSPSKTPVRPRAPCLTVDCSNLGSHS